MRRKLVRYEEAEPRPVDLPGDLPWLIEAINGPLDPNSFLNQGEAGAQKVLQDRGHPVELGLWHRTPEGEWRRPLMGEHSSSLPTHFELGTIPWLAAQILSQAKMARDAFARNDCINAFFAGVRLEQYRSDLELELKGYRKAAEIGDAVVASGRQSNLDRQRLHERWITRDRELEREQPSRKARDRARQIADEEREKFGTVRSALHRKRRDVP
jgi:hypothetical protein